MPIYEYLCTACQHRFETRQSFADEPLEDCPSCGASIRRVLHPSGVIFKGSGWYINDSRKAERGATSSTNGQTTSDGTPTASESSGAAAKPAATETKKDPAAKAASE